MPGSGRSVTGRVAPIYTKNRRTATVGRRSASGEEPRRHERRADRLPLRRGHGRERRADMRGRDSPEEHEGFLHAVVHVDEGRRVEDTNERGQPIVDVPGALEIT